MNASLTHLDRQPAERRTAAAASWRQALARLLQRVVTWLGVPPLGAQGTSQSVHARQSPQAPSGFVSHRPEVRAWFATLSPSVRQVLGDERALSRMHGVVHRLRYLPDEDTLLEFLHRVPDWDTMHWDFSAYLLRRLVSLAHKGRRPDASYDQVCAWLLERNRSLTVVPYVWADAVDAAHALLGRDCMPDQGAGASWPCHHVVRKAVQA